MSVSGGLARVSCRATGVTRILPLCWEEGAPFQATRGVAGVSGSASRRFARETQSGAGRPAFRALASRRFARGTQSGAGRTAPAPRSLLNCCHGRSSAHSGDFSALSHRSKALSGDFNGDTATRELTLETSALSLVSLLLSLRTRVLTLIAQRSHGLRNPPRPRWHSSLRSSRSVCLGCLCCSAASTPAPDQHVSQRQSLLQCIHGVVLQNSDRLRSTVGVLKPLSQT